MIFGKTPKFFVENGLFPDADLVMSVNKVENALLSAGNNEGRYHGIGVDLLCQLPKAMNTPIKVIKEDGKRYGVVVRLGHGKNNTHYAVVEIDNYRRVNQRRRRVNLIVTAFGTNESYVENQIAKGDLIYDEKEGFISQSMVKRQLLDDFNETNPSIRDYSTLDDDYNLSYVSILGRKHRLSSKTIWKNKNSVQNTQVGINQLPLILHEQAARTLSDNDYTPMEGEVKDFNNSQTDSNDNGGRDQGNSGGNTPPPSGAAPAGGSPAAPPSNSASGTTASSMRTGQKEWASDNLTREVISRASGTTPNGIKTDQSVLPKIDYNRALAEGTQRPYVNKNAYTLTQKARVALVDKDASLYDYRQKHQDSLIYEKKTLQSELMHLKDERTLTEKDVKKWLKSHGEVDRNDLSFHAKIINIL
ncbi:MAG: hypothetical protein K5629_07595 [Eubacteriales bacterium]|nr:hypothetical protein [Eubacteriales bacterium]